MFSFFPFFFTVENNLSVSTIENSPKEKEMPKMISRYVMEVVKSKLFAVVFSFLHQSICLYAYYNLRKCVPPR